MSSSDENPYAAPGTADHATDYDKVPPSQCDVELPLVCVDGKHLVVARNVTLPNRCIITNEPVDKANRVQTLSWARALQLRASTGRIRFCVSPKRLQSQRRIRMTVVGTTIVAALMALVTGTGVAAAFVVVLGVLINLAVPSDDLRVTRFERNRFWLQGCSSAFLWTCREEFGSLNNPP